ncbi:UDP-N-acetylmuramoyl-L-alanine--D-glutamate ligase [Clostridiaceae bacterium M8S5]|nr:UDP-N-acetylmuramoyl-L-alanine--D-glutamate ligase [Clostridiaceae bacterium M8S5]
MKNKKILVLGLGISGVSSAKSLCKLGAEVVVCDSKSSEQLTKYINDLKDYDIEYHLGTNNIDVKDIDLVVKSPGVPLGVEILKKAREKNIEIVTDIELAYRMSDNTMVAITGTNGKTTTTALIGEMLKGTNEKVHVTGNIGVGILWEVVNCEKNDIFVIECSSFQLENTSKFKPKISVFTNITPDHLKWHGSFENYMNAKKKIYANQDLYDYTVLNYDDKLLRNISDEINSNIIYFSTEEKIANGIYVDGNDIIVNIDGHSKKLMKCNDIRIIGKHNLENSLAAIAVSWILGVDKEVIKDTLQSFKTDEHRLEEVDTINGVTYYNDSKGTNLDSSIKALEAVASPIVLIAGGYDKGYDFKEFISAFNGKVETLILMGETAKQIENTAINLGFSNIYIVEDMKEAVSTAYSFAKVGYNVLLSPACASWDMYSNFEQRGNHFKKCVNDLRRSNE